MEIHSTKKGGLVDGRNRHKEPKEDNKIDCYVKMNQNKTPQKGRLKIKAKTTALKKGLGCVILALRLSPVLLSTEGSSPSFEGTNLSFEGRNVFLKKNKG